MRHFFRPLNGIQYLTLGLVVIMAAGFIYGFSKINSVAAQAHQGLCAQRLSVEQQMASSKKYLAQHPDGAPALGITAAQIRQQIARQKAFVRAFSNLSCS